MMRSPESAFDLRAVLVEEVQRAAESFESAPAEPKSIQRCRIALKRARAVAAVGSVSAPGLAEVFDDSARQIMRALARARVGWALQRSARRLVARVGKKARPALRDLADRAEAYQRAATPLNVESVRAGLKDVLAIAQVWPETSQRQVERGARRLLRSARKAWRHAQKSDDGRRHWRKREKARLHVARLLTRAWPERYSRRRKLNAALADALDHERDVLLVLERLIRDRPADADHYALRDLQKVHKRLAKRADKLGRRLHTGGA